MCVSFLRRDILRVHEWEMYMVLGLGNVKIRLCRGWPSYQSALWGWSAVFHYPIQWYQCRSLYAFTLWSCPNVENLSYIGTISYIIYVPVVPNVSTTWMAIWVPFYWGLSNLLAVRIKSPQPFARLRMRVQRSRITRYRQKTKNTDTQYFNMENPNREKPRGSTNP